MTEPALPTLENPGVQTVFAHDLAALNASQGIVTLSFAEVRGLNGQPPIVERRVCARIAISGAQIGPMIERLQRLQSAIALAKADVGEAAN